MPPGARDDLQPREIGHGEVNQDHVRAELLHFGQRLGASGHRANDDQPVGLLQEGGQRTDEGKIVVDQQQSKTAHVATSMSHPDRAVYSYPYGISEKKTRRTEREGPGTQHRYADIKKLIF